MRPPTGLGYQIELTGQELALIGRFVHGHKAQQEFKESDIFEPIRDWMVGEVYEELHLDDMGQ